MLRSRVVALLLLSLVVKFAQPQTTAAASQDGSTNLDPYIVVTTFRSIIKLHPWPFIATPEPIELELISEEFGGIDAVDYHLRLGLLFWTNIDDGTIMSANMNGSDPRVLVSGISRAGDLTVDWLNDNIYWTDAVERKIEELNINTGMRRVVMNTGSGTLPSSLTVYPYPNSGWLYWTDKQAEAIKRVSVSGDDETVVVPFLNGRCLGPLALDYSEQTVFWVDNCDFTIRSVNVSNGGFSSNEPIMRTAVSSLGLTVFNNILYWSETGSVYGVNRSRTEDIQLVHAGSTSNGFISLKMVHSDNQPDEETYVEQVLGNNNTSPVCVEGCVNGQCIPPGLCACERGWTGGNCTTDVNECAVSNGGCESACVNIVGSYYCSCGGMMGYTLDSNGRNCSDVNECEFFNGGCERNCSNTEGSFSCSCDPGFVLDDNLLNCTTPTSTVPTVPTVPTAVEDTSSVGVSSTASPGSTDLTVSAAGSTGGLVLLSTSSVLVTSDLISETSSIVPTSVSVSTSIAFVLIPTISDSIPIPTTSDSNPVSSSQTLTASDSIPIPTTSGSIPMSSSQSLTAPDSTPIPTTSGSIPVSSSQTLTASVSIPIPTTSGSIPVSSSQSLAAPDSTPTLTTQSISVKPSPIPNTPNPEVPTGAGTLPASSPAVKSTSYNTVLSQNPTSATPQPTPVDDTIKDPVSSVPLVIVVSAAVAGGTALIVVLVIIVVVVFGVYRRVTHKDSYSFDKEKGNKSKPSRDSVNSKTSFGIGTYYSSTSSPSTGSTES